MRAPSGKKQKAAEIQTSAAFRICGQLRQLQGKPLPKAGASCALWHHHYI
jgi:hypothetical protein